jgi:acyl-CoA thioesterase I
MKRKSILQFIASYALLAFFCNQLIYAVPAKAKVACVGNSITYGAGLSSPATQSYPPQMQTLLGDTYEVLNFGVSSRTMLKKGDYPFWNDIQYTNALAFNPDYVIIKLGTNDSKTFQWPIYKDEYPLDYKDMIKSFQSLSSHPEVIMCMLIPGQNEGWQIWDSVMRDEVNPVIKQIALDEGLALIDLYTVFENGSPDWILSDGVHPTEAGSAVIAQQVKNMITMAKPEITYSGDKLIAPDADGYQWYYNGQLISEANGGTLKELTYAASGKYKVSLKLAPGSETRIVSKEFNLNYLNGEYKIIGKYSQKYLGVKDKSLADNAYVQQFQGDTAKSQIWNIVKHDSVYFQLLNKNSFKSVTVESSSNLAGANIVQNTADESDIQLWTINDEGDGLYTFTNKSSGFAFTVLNNSDTAGAQIIQDTLEKTDNQLFLITQNQLVQSPFYSTAFEIPGTFEAEDYDLGGEGLAYHTLAINTPGQYRPNEGVTINSCVNCSAYSVSDLSSGEWIEYSINVTDTNELIVDVRLSSTVSSSKIQILIDDTDKTGSVAIPVSGDNDIWASSIFRLKLTLGDHIMRIACTEGSFNIDNISVCKNLEGSFLITLNSNGKLITVADNQTTEGASVVQNIPTGTGGQQWNIVYERGGYYKFENINSSKALSLVNDTVVQLTFTNDDSQLWQFMSNGKGYYSIRNMGNGNFLQPAQNSSTNGILIITKGMVSDGNLMYFFTSIPSDRQPFGGVPISLPGVIEAENYDLGGEGVAYHELDGLYSFGLYRSLESVDLEVCADGGYDVNYIKAGEWLKYSANADSTTDFAFTFKTSRSKAIIKIGLDDIDSVTTITVPSSGSAQVWKTATINIPLNEGLHDIKIYFLVGNINIDKVTVAYPAISSITEEKDNHLKAYPNPVTEGIVNFELPVGTSGMSELSITDISGKVIYSKQNCEQFESIEFTKYPSGLYFVKFRNNTNTTVGKIIKK